eukprot:gene10392-21671_t
MPFCYNFVQYSTCLPKIQTLPPSRQYPDGRWFNHTVKTKDTWVQQQCDDQIELRRDLERNKTLKNLGVNEYGDKGTIFKRFYKNRDCQNAYRAYFCWINFPRCNMDTDATLPTCRSACHNFFKSCAYPTSLWRCYESKYFNARTPESPSGNRTYLRDFFPGQPFRENDFTVKGEPIAVCTPSLKGTGARHGASVYVLVITLVLSLYSIALTVD